MSAHEMQQKIEKVGSFLEALDDLSREHGVWIDTEGVFSGRINLINENLDIIASGFESDGDSQEYVVDSID